MPKTDYLGMNYTERLLLSHIEYKRNTILLL